MADFIEVTGLEQIPPGGGTPFKVADMEIAIFTVNGKISAIADTCPHAGGSLGMGKLDGRIGDLSGAWNEIRRDYRVLRGDFG